MTSETQTDPAWTEEDSEVYRELSSVAVPDRERQIAIVTELVAGAQADGPILELCSGEGLWTRALLDALPGATVIACDGSESMLEETRRTAGDPARLETRLFDLAADDWRTYDGELRAVVSSLAVHHLDGGGKRTLFADLHRALRPGGVFVLADVIRPATRLGDGIAARMWDEETRRRSQARDGTLAAYERFSAAGWNHFHDEAPDPVDKPSAVREHFDWLGEAGFTDVDMHWMLAGQALFSAWKR